MNDAQVVLITGASSGVGQAAARALSRHRYRVFGTGRDPARAPAIPEVEMLALEVCSDDSVDACVKAVFARAGRLDVLINNAAYELAGALEETSVEEAKAQFETNFFGVVRMVRAVLPSMRERRQGRIVNVSSFSGVSAIPFMGIYSASKFALEGYTEALRMEVEPFHIHVSLTEAGFLKTPMGEKRRSTAVRLQHYEPWRQRSLNAIRRFELGAPGPELVADTLLEIVASGAPRLRYLIGSQAKGTSSLMRFLPAGTYERGKRKAFALDRDE